LASLLQRLGKIRHVMMLYPSIVKGITEQGGHKITLY